MVEHNVMVENILNVRIITPVSCSYMHNTRSRS